LLEKKISVYNKIIQKVKDAKYIAIISHKNPDLDTIWSAIAFYQAIKENFLYKNIDLICNDEIPKKYKFLPNINLYKTDFNPKNYDLIIFFDASSKSQSWFDEKFQELFDKTTYNTLNIDHHITNEIFAKQNIVNATYSSTTMIVYEILKYCFLKISPSVATCLLAWIYTDTWWLKHSNTTYMTYLMTSELVNLWWKFNLTVDNFFKKNKLSTIKLWWKIISDSFIDNKWILQAYVNKTMLDSYNSTYDDISWVIDHLNTAEWIKYCSLLTQKWEYIKASLRTLRDDIDLTKIALEYNWWWHKKASGFSLKAKIEEIHSLNFKK